jgi:hypothetical protein
MARLYEYVESNDDSGYFLSGAYEDGNVTFQIESTGERLLNRIGYEPGIKNRERGPQIPPDLKWAMFDEGLIETGGSQPSGERTAGDFDFEASQLTREELDRLEDFVADLKMEGRDLRELAEAFDIELEDGSTPIWELSGE